MTLLLLIVGVPRSPDDDELCSQTLLLIGVSLLLIDTPSLDDDELTPHSLLLLTGVPLLIDAPSLDELWLLELLLLTGDPLLLVVCSPRSLDDDELKSHP